MTQKIVKSNTEIPGGAKSSINKKTQDKHRKSLRWMVTETDMEESHHKHTSESLGATPSKMKQHTMDNLNKGQTFNQ